MITCLAFPTQTMSLTASSSLNVWQPRRAIDSVIEEMVETVGGGKHCKVLHGNN